MDPINWGNSASLMAGLSLSTARVPQSGGIFRIPPTPRNRRNAHVEPNSEVFMWNVPRNLTYSQIGNKLLPHCRAIDIYAYRVRIIPQRGHGNRNNGIVAFDSVETAEKFLESCGNTSIGQARHQIVVNQCKLGFKRSDKPADKHLMASLKEQKLQALKVIEEEKARARETGMHPQISKGKDEKKFSIVRLECGVWGACEEWSKPRYEPRYSVARAGKLRFDRRSILVDLEPDSARPGIEIPAFTVSFFYSAIQNIIVDYSNGVIFTLRYAPRIYRHRQTETPELGQQTSRFRSSGIDEMHSCFVATSFVYRVTLRSEKDRAKVLRLSQRHGTPPIVPKIISPYIGQPATSFATAFLSLRDELTTFDFAVAFQLNALFANGVLSPQTILELLPHVRAVVDEIGGADAAIALQCFVEDLRIPGASHRQQTTEELLENLEFSVRNTFYLRPMDTKAKAAIENQNLVYVYHATITPAGCYFYGPTPEASNRVLRKYKNQHDHFMRVLITEEDNDFFHQELGVSNNEIFDGQFRLYLNPSNPGITIAGRRFSFLGFSSSSLRSQSCWFMAPFHDPLGRPMAAANVIRDLGDFSSIKNPGRYMARVGQAFSDTLGSIHVSAANEVTIPDIERIEQVKDDSGEPQNVKRCFTDGIGTISRPMLEKIWNESERVGRDEPTVFQIRFRGAKGVVTLDPALVGEKLCLRSSMIKFNGSSLDRDIEICSWPKRLPFFLNKSLIKVLEDLKVEPGTFLHLQRTAVKELRDAGTSPENAANFLKRQSVSSHSLKLWWVIEVLKNLGIDFREDPFMEKIFEMSLLVVLRDIKYRARIPVPLGVTLIGVVDETGFLNEGQVYVTSMTQEGEKEEITGSVMITRSPVIHPGDVQMVQAVLPPRESPLNLLKNCVVFSQKGTRDLPSKLAGGDLDGDLYNIVRDPRFRIKQPHPAADYPRQPPLEFDRPVTETDVVDFFIDFMRNNLVGMIANRHLQIADQQGLGVFHPDCLKLAQLHSIAVDFPKTGVPVERKEFPRASLARPDFMAPGPRVLVEKEKVVHQTPESIPLDEDDEEHDDAISYYASSKILGRLYREIDETQFLKVIHESASEIPRGPGGSVAERLWNFAVRETGTNTWREYLDFAKPLRESYEKQLYAMMWDYSEAPWRQALTETEVVIGTIVGGDKQTRAQREASTNMRDHFDYLATNTVGAMKGKSHEMALDQSMACLFVCLPQGGTPSNYNLESFTWVAAGVLLAEVDRIQRERKIATAAAARRR